MPRSSNAGKSASEASAPAPAQRQTRSSARVGNSRTPDSSVNDPQPHGRPKASTAKKVLPSVETFDPVPRRGAPRPKMGEPDLLSQVSAVSATDATGSQITVHDSSQASMSNDSETGKNTTASSLPIIDEDEAQISPEQPAQPLSQEENDLEQDIALADARTLALPNLSRASEQLNESLAALIESDANEAWKTVHIISRQSFAAVRELYVREGESLIGWPRIIEVLNQDVRWMAEGVMASANLTTLIDSLTNISHGQEELFYVLERMDPDFPLPFMPWTHSGRDGTEWALTEKHAELAIEIRTQRLIETLHKLKRKNKRRNPATVAAALFCAVSESADAQQMLLEGPFMSVLDKELEPGTIEFEITQARTRSILSKIGTAKNLATAVKSLEESYPLESFLSSLSDWASGHIRRIQKALHDNRKKEKQRAETPALYVSDAEEGDARSEALRSRQAADEPPAGRSLFKGPGSVQRLVSSLRKNKGGPPPSNQEQSILRSVPNTRGTSGGAADTTSGPAARTELPTSSHAANPARRSESVDTDAQILNQLPSRISFPRSSQAPSQSAPRELAVRGGPSGYRPPPDVDVDQNNDEEEQDDFETDTRQPNSRKRAADTAAMPPPPSRRARTTVEPPDPQNEYTPAPSRDRDAVGANTQSVAIDDVDWKALAQQNRMATQYQIASTQVGSQRSQERRYPKQRMPWSNRDVLLLIRYIDERQCNWAGIAARVADDRTPAEDRFEHPRDQQAIRDKARNLKVDLLKADLRLPSGFDLVALGKKERIALIARGKNPDRREGDIIGDRPTRTQFHDDDFD